MSSARARSGGSSIGKHVEPVVEVFAKLRIVSQTAQIAIRGRDDADVDARIAALGDTVGFLALERAQ